MKALIVVDCQNDLIMPGGALAVPDGDKIIPVINELLSIFELVIFTKDRHGADDAVYSFETDFYKDLDFSKCKKDFYIFKKNFYSAFIDTSLQEFLEEKKVTDVYIVGLALDEAVKETAIGAVAIAGFKTIVIEDASRPKNEDINKTLQDFKEYGVYLIDSWELDLFNLVK